MKLISHIKQRLQFFPKAHLIVFSALLFLLVVSQCMQDSQSARKTIKVDIPLPQTSSSVIEEETAEDDLLEWHIQQVKSGDSLSKIFKRQGISSTVLHQLISTSEHAKMLLNIHPGKEVLFGFDEKQVLQQLKYSQSKLSQILVTRIDADTFASEHIVRTPEIRLAYKKAVIEDILSLAGEKAGMPYVVTMKVANILSGVVDFVFDVRKGHSFDVLYEEKFLDGERIAIGNVLAASYSNHEETFTAYRYTFKDGSSNYYSPDGISMQKPFLRTPLDSFRVSSSFNLKRRHPIHKKIRAHRGIDYAAPRGTPIFTVADGRVRRSGFSRANGNYVFITHPGGYETKYLHLQRRYVKTGQKVKQGTTIGTLGSTGYSTGPHLHYEFLVNGVHRNPKTIYRKLPSAAPIPKADKTRFQLQIKKIQQQYENFQQGFEDNQT